MAVNLLLLARRYLFISICIWSLCQVAVQASTCSNCLYGSRFCIPDTGVCVFGCVSGFKGSHCNSTCSNTSNCKECADIGNGQEECTRCYPGWYGSNCSKTCSVNCRGTELTDDVCDFHGTCIYGCVGFYTGKNCTTVSCPFENCDECDVNDFRYQYCRRCKQGYYWTHERQVCTPCKGTCGGSCDQFSGHCTQCPPSMFGIWCEKYCSVGNCTKCATTLNIECEECAEGMFPSTDRTTCLPCSEANCKDGRCNRSSGSCPSGCKEGYYGTNKRCDHICNIQHCTECIYLSSRSTLCLSCARGYYLDNYSCHPCPVNCNKEGSSCNGTNCQTQNYCNNSGECIYGCKHGYYGKKCAYGCNQHCTYNVCDFKTGVCTYGCAAGLYGPYCNRVCPIHCVNCNDFSSGECKECEPGWFGPACDSKCSDNCLKDSYSNILFCDKETGACRSGCIPGFHGTKCDMKCNRNCDSNICERDTGDCSSSCNLGWYGEKCDKPCPENCNPRHLVSVRCHLVTGICDNGCKTGYYGDMCQFNCSKNCMDNVCNQGSGKCSYGCENGYYGERCENECEYRCPTSCYPNCLNDKCHSLTRVCSEGCVPGWYGNTCIEICSKTCAGWTCDRHSGECSGLCQDGYWGKFCKLECNRNCIDGLCKKETGECTLGCLPTFYGSLCTERCSYACSQRSCEMETGFCHSCPEGKYGNFCDQDCLPGTYGENCKETCGHCKNSSPCFPVDGRCPYACETGWTGPTCTQALLSSEPSDSLSTPIQIAIGCSVGGVVCCLTILLIVCWFKHRRQKKSPKAEDPVVVYHNTRVEIQNPRSSHQETSTNHHGDADNQSSCHSSLSQTEPTSLLLGNLNAAQIKLKEKIQDGKFCSLYLGEVISQGKQTRECCVKYSQLTDLPNRETVIQRLQQEVEILTLAGSHVTIVNLITTYQNKDVLCIALEKCALSGIHAYLHDLEIKYEGTNLDPIYICQLVRFAIDVCSAVSHIHKLKVVHRTLQLGHVYLTDTLIAKLGDFSWAQVMAEESDHVLPDNVELPPEYMPWLSPESVLYNRFSWKSDIWSLGLLMWELFSLGQAPYQNLDEDGHREALKQNILPRKPEMANFTLYRVMKICWHYDGEDRPSPQLLMQKLLDEQGKYADEESMTVQV